MSAALAMAYALCCAGVVLFQLALVCGAPWGHLTQGGQVSGALPLKGRALAVLSAVLLVAMGYAMLSAVGQGAWPRWTGWAAVSVSALSSVANWATPSRPERRLWGPITTAMLALAFGAMLSSRSVVIS